MIRLSREQALAAGPLDGPVRVVAGAGTGKTAVIAERFRRLVARGVEPAAILVLTFTERAAAEMRERILAAVPGAEAAPVGTFHAMALSRLREDGRHVGLRPGFRILAGADQWISLRELMWEMGDPVLVGEERPDDLVAPLLKLEERLKQELVPLARVRDWAVRNAADDRAERLGAAVRLFRAHGERCRKEGLVDFADLIVSLVRLFESRPDVRARHAGRFRWLLVDEYQDTNLAQERVVELLAAEAGNVCVVGDDDQSIYRFRGASRASMDRFLACFPEARTRGLGRNRRSSARIVAASRTLIEHNRGRAEKPLSADRRLGSGPRVEIWRCRTGAGEAGAVAAAIAALAAAGTRLSRIAVLTRTHAIAGPPAAALEAAGIPFQHRAGPGLLRRPEVRDLVAYLRLLHDPGDLLALARLLVRPPLRLDLEAALARIRTAGAGDGAAAAAPLRALRGWAPATAWAGLVLELVPLKASLGVDELLFEVVDRTRHLERLAPPGSLEAARVGANAGRFAELVSDWCERRRDHSLSLFLEHLELVLRSGLEADTAEPEGLEEAVQVMTIHQAKGLEFEAVFLPGLVEGRLPQPHRPSGLDLPVDILEPAVRGREDHVAEERRLLYVGMTRARRRLVLSWAERYEGARAWRPSRFLAELGPGTLAVEADSEPAGTAAALPIPPRAESACGRGPDPVLSFSGIASYRECPRRHWYRSRLRLPAPASPEAQFGTILHLALHRAGRRRQEGGAITREELRDLYLEAWDTVGLTERRRRPALEALGRGMLDGFWEAGELEARPHLLEFPFEAAFEGWTLRGIIDRVDRLPAAGPDAPGWRLIDYKSGSPEPAGRLRRDLQLALYALGAREALALDRVELDIVYLRSGRHVRFEAAAELLDEARRLGSEAAEGIRAGRFEPAPERRRCSLCPYRLACEAAL